MPKSMTMSELEDYGKWRDAQKEILRRVIEMQAQINKLTHEVRMLRTQQQPSISPNKWEFDPGPTC